MDFDALQFGQRLKAERERLQLSQQAAAEKCGVRREMWGKYERGAAEPGVRVLARLGAEGADVLYLLLGRYEVNFAEGEGLIHPMEIAAIVHAVKRAFDREGVSAKNYFAGDEERAQATFFARIVGLAAAIYNEVRSSEPGGGGDAMRQHMATSAAITERLRFADGPAPAVEG